MASISNFHIALPCRVSAVTMPAAAAAESEEEHQIVVLKCVSEVGRSK